MPDVPVGLEGKPRPQGGCAGMATWRRENPSRLLVAAGLLAAAIWLGHGCIPGVGANQSPPVGIRQLVAHDQTCIGIDGTAICDVTRASRGAARSKSA